MPIAEVTEIEVTQEDIDKGEKGGRYSCPIALAANRAFGMDEGCNYGEGLEGWILERYEQRYEVEGGFWFASAFDGIRDDPEAVKPRKFKLNRLDDEFECSETP